MMEHYIDSVSVDDENMYCKICGEMIRAVNVFDENENQDRIGTGISDEINKNIYSETLHAMSHFTFNTMVNPTQLVQAVISACYPPIKEIEKQLIKNKTNTSEDIKNKRKLFVSIYVYVYMIHIMLAKDKLAKNIDMRLKRISGDPTVSALLGAISTIIINTKNTIITKIEGANNDFIKSKIIEAFNVLKSVGVTDNIVSIPLAENILITLFNDPIYKYVHDGYHRGSGKHNLKLSDDYDKILGANIKQLSAIKKKTAKEAEINIYADLEPVKHRQSVHLNIYINIRMVQKYHPRI
jgi:hypothetical protein